MQNYFIKDNILLEYGGSVVNKIIWINNKIRIYKYREIKYKGGNYREIKYRGVIIGRLNI